MATITHTHEDLSAGVIQVPVSAKHKEAEESRRNQEGVKPFCHYEITAAETGHLCTVDHRDLINQALTQRAETP